MGRVWGKRYDDNSVFLIEIEGFQSYVGEVIVYDE